jgi:sentrin-specific protease 1
VVYDCVLTLCFSRSFYLGKDIFKLNKIIFPINQGNQHWTMAVAFMDEKRIQFYDSFGGNGDRYVRDLFQYLQDEHLDKRGTLLPDLDSWTLVGATTRDTPRQRNGYDCGVFVCMFADFLAMGYPLCFGQDDLPRCRQRIALAILNGRDVL